MGFIKIFSLNRYKSEKIKKGLGADYCKHSPIWAINSNGCIVNNHNHIINSRDGLHYVTEDEWNAYVDEKYLRR